ncbi:hypothetical protein ACSYAD_19345 [Acaryochloris marina NIES-2412]|uniref:hypothetical protein n=1 Tax=Acaryochloris marina TaxID=155978 RepID=UPI004059E400
MNHLFHPESYSIWITAEAIAVYSGKFGKEGAKLLCLCHNYQAALRISRTAAKLHQLSLYLFASPSIFGAAASSNQSEPWEVGCETL